jgi:signal transduction histidine kinase
MNESDSSNNEYKKSDEWKSWSPEFFLSVLLHETRTPLMIIKGYVEILSNEETKEQHPQALKSISRAVGTLEDLWEDTRDYLAFTRKP